MKYIVRKVPERDVTYFEYLIPEAIFYNDALHEGPIKSFVGAMKLAQDDAVYIQDDMLLCRDFKARCDAVCKAHKDEVVQLANNTFRNVKTRVLVGGHYPADKVPWCLCIYIPWRLASAFVDWYESGRIKPTKFETNGYSDDLLFSRFMKKMKEDEYLVVPNLAGHPMNKSIVGKLTGRDVRDGQIRISMNFEYDKAVARGDISREIEYYKRDYGRYEKLRAEQYAQLNGGSGYGKDGQTEKGN